MANPFNKKQGVFSIGIPVYGEGYQLLPSALEGLNGQEYKNFHVVVIFDGKNTKGVKLLEKIMKDYDFKIEHHTIEHGGAPKARNEAVKYFTGDYYLFHDVDIIMYPETLRIHSNAFEEDPEVFRVWGRYDVVDAEGNVIYSTGNVPMVNGEVWYKALQYTNYIDTNNPIRADHFIPWSEDVKSLQDWDWAIRQLQPDFSGKGFKHIPRSLYATRNPEVGNISHDSHNNWIERKEYVQKKNGIKSRDICVTSLGAMNHAVPTAEMLDAEILPMPSFKPHKYKLVYLLGFYTREDPNHPGHVTKSHIDVFKRNKGKNVIHWIGTDIYDLQFHDSFMKLKAIRKWLKEDKVINLCECKTTQNELKELGIDAKIIPIPPAKQYKPIPLPEKFTVGVYLPGRTLYMPQLISDVTRAMPDVQFYFFGNDDEKGQKGENWESLGYIDYDEWLPKLSCNLRMTTHDGLPLTSIQFLQAGRNVVTNFPIKGAIKVKDDLESVVEGLRKAQENPLKDSVAQHWIREMDTEKFKKRIEGLK